MDSRAEPGGLAGGSRRQAGRPSRPGREAGSGRTLISELWAPEPRGWIPAAPRRHICGGPSDSLLLSLLQMRRPWAGWVGEQQRLQPSTGSRGVCAAAAQRALPPGLTEQGIPGSSCSAHRPCQAQGPMLGPSQPDLCLHRFPPLSQTVKNRPAGQLGL